MKSTHLHYAKWKHGNQCIEHHHFWLTHGRKMDAHKKLRHRHGHIKTCCFLFLKTKTTINSLKNHVDRRKRLEFPARLRHAAISSQCRTRERDAKDVLKPFDYARFINRARSCLLISRRKLLMPQIFVNFKHARIARLEWSRHGQVWHRNITISDWRTLQLELFNVVVD